MKALLTSLLIGITFIVNAQQRQPKTNVKDTAVYTSVEQQPQFSADESAFNKYLSKKVRYVITDTIGHNFEGRFIASFIVEKDGTLSHIKMLRPTWDSATGRLFVKALRDSPKWRPGIQDGYIIGVLFSISMSISVSFD